MGNRPKPAELRLLEGNRGHRSIPNTPKPKPVFSKPPKTLDKYGRKEWRKRGKELYRMGLLTVLDLPAFEIYCDWYSEWIQATTLTAKKEAGHQVRMFMIEFGMTPSSRTRLSVDEEKEENEMEALLNRGRNK